ncbi:MAG TPA: FKBP-type peptidyl-prolyl cis-trans isomerase [Crenotrichaceae bacterium]|nr:FKBP-type peptidyl-prolyl cis-trans isomerase [Crenotrichaceae bacterium]
MKKSIATFFFAVAGANMSLQAADLKLETDRDKLSYSLGMMIAERVAKPYKDINYEVLLEGLKAQHTGQETLLKQQDANMIISDYHTQLIKQRSSKAKLAGDQYLAENAKKQGVTVTKSGLQYEVLKAGDGPKPKATDTVSVHYVGTLLDGTEFDSSVKRGTPSTFPLNRVIPGWTEGVQLMNVGSKYRFVIPSDLAYGTRGAGGKIGPGETLIFEIELLEIKDS